MRIEQMRKHAEQMHEHLRQDLAATEIEATAVGELEEVIISEVPSTGCGRPC